MVRTCLILKSYSHLVVVKIEAGVYDASSRATQLSMFVHMCMYIYIYIYIYIYMYFFCKFERLCVCSSGFRLCDSDMRGAELFDIKPLYSCGVRYKCKLGAFIICVSWCMFFVRG